MSEELVQAERGRLAECERIIERGIRTFYEVGTALAEVRDERLYRETHGTFEAYCEERWELKRQRAYQLMEAAQVSKIFDTEDHQPNESHARELGRVPKEERAEVWEETNERTNGKPTAKAIRETWQGRQEPEPPPLPEHQDEADEAAAGFDETHAVPEPETPSPPKPRKPRTDVVGAMATAINAAQDAAEAAERIERRHLSNKKEEAAVWSRSLSEALDPIQRLNNMLKEIED